MFDFSVLKKYQKAGPRYTSYPTAIEFSENFSYDEYIKSLKDEAKNYSLYFHLPFCRSACYFCGCNVIYTSKEDKKTRYLDYIFRELDILKSILKPDKKVVQMHFGGGTPTFFNAKELDLLICKIKDVFSDFDDEAEISCEIDPRFFSEDQAKVLTSQGFNRISFGVQDFDEVVQKTIHRLQPYKMTQKAIELARAYGIKSINMDLIYGLPYQSLETFSKTLEKAITLDPDRLAIFNYAHLPWLKKNMRKFDESTLPDAATKLEILKHCESYLTQNGYAMIGMDHFAKPDDELFKALKNHSLHRNFQGYTTKGGAKLIGIGLTSIGEGADYYAQNYKDMELYEKAIDSGILPYQKGIKLSLDDLIRKDVIMSLMANYFVDIKDIENRYKISFVSYFKDSLKTLEELNEFYTIDDDYIKVNTTGILLIRNIAMCFDAYYAKTIGQKIFSKTI